MNDQHCACGDILFMPTSRRIGKCINCREKARRNRLDTWEDDAHARNSAAHAECNLILGACRRLEEEVHA